MSANQLSPRESAAEGRATLTLSPWPTICFLVGVLFLYLGERAIGDPERLRQGADAAGAVLMATGFLWRSARMTGSRDPAQKKAESWLLLASFVVTVGVAVYFGFSLGKDALRESFGKGFDRVDGAAMALWPMLVLGGSLPLVLMQRALHSMTNGSGRAEHVDLQRVRYSAQSGIAVALVVIFCFAVNYVAAERNTKYDLARFRSTRPSPATQKLVQNLSKPVRATLFYPSPNEVRDLLVPYFEDLARLSPSGSFTFEVIDHALEPGKAKELAATGNGMVILSALDDKGKAGQKESLHIGTTLEAAQSPLATFDGDIQKRLLTLSKPGRIAYFTVGHGERGFEKNSAMDLQKDDLRAPIGDLRQVLQSQGYEVKTLGIGQGLGSKVPGDATLVFVAGPTDKLFDEEVAALTAYLQGGGHVFVLLDPSAEAADASLAPLLAAGGMKFHPQLLCNAEVYAVRTHTPSDQANIASVSFSSHPSVTTLSRAGGRAALILPRTGWLEREGKPEGVAVDFTVRSMPKTWADLDGDFVYKAGTEAQKVYDIAGVASKAVDAAQDDKGGKDGKGKDKKDKKEMRLAVLGSIEAASDVVLPNKANLYYMLDTIKWMTGDEALAAETAPEADLPIVHTKSEDKLWFYSTIFAAPALLLIIGLLYSGRVRRRRAS